MSIDALEPQLSEKVGNIIEWTPIVSRLEQDNKNKEITLKKFNTELSVKSKKLSKFNMAINKLFGALEQKRLTGNEVRRDPIKMSSNIMLSMVSVFIGGISYSAWQTVPELAEYSPWFSVIVATVVIGVLVHANEKRKKEELEAQDIDIS
jgi:leucyl-tRNA synthetase